MVKVSRSNRSSSTGPAKSSRNRKAKEDDSQPSAKYKKPPRDLDGNETYAEFIENADEVEMDEENSEDDAETSLTFTGNRDVVAQVSKFKEDAEGGSIKALQKLAGVYKALLSAKDEQTELASAEIYHVGISTALQTIPVYLKSKLGTEAKRQKHWKKCGPILKSFLTNTLKLLKTTTEHTPFVIEKLCPLAVVLKAFPVRLYSVIEPLYRQTRL